MFHTIILQSAADVDGLLSLTRMSQQDQWRGPIATYIQKLWIVERGSSWAHEFFLQIGSKLVKLAELGYFNHLATMNQSSHTHPVVLQFIKSNFRSVQSFTLFQQHFGSFVDLARLVGTLRNIRVLSCEQVTWDNSAREPRSFMASTLETVYIKKWKFSLSIGEHEPTDWELVSDSPNVQFGVVSYTHPRHEADDASVTSLLLRDHRFATTSDLVNLIVKLRDLESLECHGIYWDEQSDDRPVIHTSGKLSTITVSGSQEFWPMIWLLVGCEEDPQQAHGTFAGPILPSVDIAAITGILRSFYFPEISKATFRRIHSSCPSAECK
ncbi:hypothetical protein PHLCEN_2v8756 [Hermanssonia centrifuga]|uniref:Uncharacterized protein n=1 Tax=Hermanssonia centrifuga TaxID=98765 RepID=A0A2R6NTI2_9APHY|nr:hypothetical protein PHLCEN_2v8756 [Hermanssonia centrifuga]